LAIKVETIPYVPLLVFKKKRLLNDEMKRPECNKDAYARENNITVWIEAIRKLLLPTAKESNSQNKGQGYSKFADHRIRYTETRIETIMSKRAAKEPTVKVMVRTSQNKHKGVVGSKSRVR